MKEDNSARTSDELYLLKGDEYHGHWIVFLADS